MIYNKTGLTNEAYRSRVTMLTHIIYRRPRADDSRSYCVRISAGGDA